LAKIPKDWPLADIETSARQKQAIQLWLARWFVRAFKKTSGSSKISSDR